MKQLIVFPNCPESSALLSSLSENISTHEILFAGCQSVESKLAFPCMIHKGKGLYKFPHHPELFSVSLICCCFPSYHTMHTCFSLHHAALPYYCSFPLHINLIFSFPFCLNFLLQRVELDIFLSYVCLCIRDRLNMTGMYTRD